MMSSESVVLVRFLFRDLFVSSLGVVSTFFFFFLHDNELGSFRFRFFLTAVSTDSSPIAFLIPAISFLECSGRALVAVSLLAIVLLLSDGGSI